MNNDFNINSFTSTNELILERAIKSNNLAIIELIVETNNLHFYYSGMDQAQESNLWFQSLKSDSSSDSAIHEFKKFGRGFRDVNTDKSSDIHFAYFSMNKSTNPKIVEILIVKFYESLKKTFEDHNQFFCESLIKAHVDKDKFNRFNKEKPKKLTNFIKQLVKVDAYEQLASVFKPIIQVSVINDLVSALLSAIAYALFYGVKKSCEILMEIYETSVINLNYHEFTTNNKIFEAFKNEMFDK